MVVSGPDLHGLALVLVRQKTLQDRFSTARKICFKALGKLALGQGADDEPAGSYQAFMKMLRIWTASLVLQLMVVFRERMRTRSLIGSPSPALKSSPSMAVGSKCRGRSPTSRSFLLGRLRSGGVARARNGASPLASRPDGAFPCQEGQQPPGMADGHVACGDRPALGLANRALRQQ